MTKDDFAQYLGQITVSLPYLMSLVPADKLEWAPAPGKFMPLRALIRHLAECPRMISVTAKNQFPDAPTLKKIMAENDNLRATPQEAQAILKQNLDQALADLATLSEENYKNIEVASPLGTMKMWRMLLLGSEHLLSHKMQLFMYLKLLGQPVSWANLMRGK